MKVVLIYERPCSHFLNIVENNISKVKYIGFSIQNNKIIHYVSIGNRLIHVPCANCIMLEFLKKAPLVSMPYFDGEHFVFVFAQTAALEKSLRAHRHKVTSYKRVTLTERQKTALKAFTQGGLNEVAAVLGISKPAACRLVKRALSKVAETI